MSANVAVKQLVVLFPFFSPQFVEPVLECVRTVRVLLVQDKTVGNVDKLSGIVIFKQIRKL